MAPLLLAALAATFAPARAASALGRHHDPDLASDAARMTALPRAARLAALAEALSRQPRPSRAAAGEAAAHERPAVAALLRSGAGPEIADLLRRLVHEREWA